jgi:hypothetical protein
MVRDQDARELKEGIDEILLLLQGDGSELRPGLVMRVDRLEQADKRRKGAIAVLWTAIVAAVVCVLDAGLRLLGVHRP